MSYWDYREDQLIWVDLMQTKGGISTVLSLAKLFELGLDVRDWTSYRICFCGVDRLDPESLQVLKDLLEEYRR